MTLDDALLVISGAFQKLGIDTHLSAIAQGEAWDELVKHKIDEKAYIIVTTDGVYIGKNCRYTQDAVIEPHKPSDMWKRMQLAAKEMQKIIKLNKKTKQL